jgi:hypothetical protein
MDLLREEYNKKPENKNKKSTKCQALKRKGPPIKRWHVRGNW